MEIGSNGQFSLIVGIAPSFEPTPTLWINPLGIVNAANYTPITNAYAPGELVNIYGTFDGVSAQSNKVLPIPTTLGGVQVFVNGLAAPVQLVSETQISAVIPFEISGQYFATFQVEVNGSKSNQVTVYADATAPGIYTLSENGIGEGAILHGDYTAVTDSHPAQPGESVFGYMVGLGAVTPQVKDGAPGPSSPLSNSVETADIGVFLLDGEDVAEANVSFAGLAPGFAGLYQVNFTLPTDGLENGEVVVAFVTTEALNEMATINVSGFPKGEARTVPSHRSFRLRRPTVAGATHVKHAQKFRRALPERSKENSGLNLDQ